MKPRILVVDDEESIREFLEIMLKKEGYEITLAEDGQKAKDLLTKKSFDMIISDLQMPHVTGIELLKHVKESYPDTVFMLITAFGTTETAVEAMKMGAYDYLTKPFKIDEVRLNIQNALRSRNLEVENRTLKKELTKEYSFQSMVGNSPAMHAIFDMVKRVSQTPTNVLITGESGTGKEVVAKAIHYNGPLKDRPFVTVNCGAIPENLMESEMFGHKKGSFTGAVADKSGLFEVADTGTLFLDEVGELPLTIQVKLLRAIQERVVRRVGATEDVKVEVRIIAATNRNLEEMVAKGTFRQDLFYRLNVINIKTPSLRERREDVPLLANHFLKKYNERLNKNIGAISAEAMEILKKYDYPGNVRELENMIERTVALEGGATILPESLPPMVNTASGRKMASSNEIEMGDDGVDLDKVMGQIEKELLVKAIHSAGGVKKRAAKLLHISFRSMRYRIEKYNLGVVGDDELDDE
ncbi:MULTISPECIES: sigma-54 dependent transcriptional regulator [unclassified Bdellovibrio]|jgi:two-component system response regulator PilR (NtrC family)|uniref:sigma-54-dependent transcriptional regulator n=1 Tax=unclassified Bdellovibrio TaxID=2633795 RepID=UPI001159DBCA|nr:MULTISPECIES: sigma-54 dependent transcriptional regulator [unclassified Bdellovibrio]QDK45115.1 sigma-54-dependent Fis family transcriptional regulator [Bdellovibrio sp. ZAP7]QLY26820.1 sigma-54-dependent Fis family transcriptional regulator [Bdellovibrio sp. KM01]